MSNNRDIPGIPCEKLLDGMSVKSSRDKIKFAAEEEDPGAVVGEGAKAARVGLELLDPAVETFSGGVGNRIDEIVQEAGEMGL